MEQRLSVVTLGTDNLSAAKSFYENMLGWKPVAENNDIIFYQMNGFLLSITSRTSLADFIGIPDEGSGFRGLTLSYNLKTEEEVRALYQELTKKGVKILKEPTAPPFGGLFFYFADPDGNILEVACNSFVLYGNKMNVIGHKSIEHL